MDKTLKDAIKSRRSYYSIANRSPISDIEIQELIEFAVKNTPSPFNSQSARVVLLLGEEHIKLWGMVKDALKRVSLGKYESAEKKVNASFQSGYGTVLFFEDQDVVESLENTFPSYKEKFSQWSEQSAGMLQFVVWTMLEEAGFGASLQHYNPLIDAEVMKEWDDVQPSWKLVAQMPFGVPTEEPGEKEFKPLTERVKVYK